MGIPSEALSLHWEAQRRTSHGYPKCEPPLFDCTAYDPSLTEDRYLNDTWVYNTTSPSCPRDKTSSWCETYRGGLYDPDGSSTAQAVADVFAAGASPSDTYRAAGLHVWESAWTMDDLGAGSFTLHDYPIGMPGFDYGTQNHPQGALGLGPNSTLLTALKDAGHIASKSYGYWWGEDGATSNAQMDGSLVLGGYDAAKTQGANITIPLRTPSVACMSGMHLTISDIVMRFPNSTRANVVVSVNDDLLQDITDRKSNCRATARRLPRASKSTSLLCFHSLETLITMGLRASLNLVQISSPSE